MRSALEWRSLGAKRGVFSEPFFFFLPLATGTVSRTVPHVTKFWNQAKVEMRPPTVPYAGLLFAHRARHCAF